MTAKKNHLLRKEKNNFKYLGLEKNFDILDYLGKNNQNRPKFVVGFSAETNDLINNSILKMKKKYCDLIIANDVSKKNTGFNVDYNQVSLIDKSGKIEKIKKNRKSYIASKIAEKIINNLINDKNIN